MGHPDEPEFDGRYAAWTEAVVDRRVLKHSVIAPYCAMPEFDAIVDLGDKALPHILKKLDDPEQGVFGIALAQAAKRIKKWPDSDFRFGGNSTEIRNRLRAEVGSESHARMKDG